MTTTDETTALAHGNAVLAELGIPPCADIAALTREVRDRRAGYAAASQRLTSLEKVLAALPRSLPDLRTVRARIVKVLDERGPQDTRQIVRALAGEIPENLIRAQIWCLQHRDQCIVRGQDGWEFAACDLPN